MQQMCQATGSLTKGIKPDYHVDPHIPAPADIQLQLSMKRIHLQQKRYIKPHPSFPDSKTLIFGYQVSCSFNQLKNNFYKEKIFNYQFILQTFLTISLGFIKTNHLSYASFK